MFEKIFGIFRKRKQTDISGELSSEGSEDVFDIGEASLDNDLEADTISLETGMSDGGFTSAPASGEGSSLDFADSFDTGDISLDDGLGLAVEGEEVDLTMPSAERPVSPLPDADAYAPSAPRRALKGFLSVAAAGVVGLVIGFFAIKPVIAVVQGLLSSGSLLQEQLAELQSRTTEFKGKLDAYAEVGTVEEILAMRDELARRKTMTEKIDAINSKISDEGSVKKRVDGLAMRLEQTQRELSIQRGTLANVQKSVKQIEARNEYLIFSTRNHLDEIEQMTAKSEKLKSRLSRERVEKAQGEALYRRDIQEGLERIASEALSSL